MELEDFMNSLEHPLKAEIQKLRSLILSVNADITEGIKWNSLSFRTTDWFATLNKRATDRIEVVLHLGAKVKAESGVTDMLASSKFLKWLGPDRALLVIPDGTFLSANQDAIKDLISKWTQYV